MRDLRGKTALVTGAASGIGRATARALARAGARVLACDVDDEGLAQLGAELGDACLLARHVDVGDRAAMLAFADEVHARVPALDVLVNNAGVGLQGGLLGTSLEDWDWVLRVNLGGVIHGCHFFVPRMVARGTGGHVVNVSSVLGVFAPADTIGYATSKFAVFGLTESLRSELAPYRIGVSTICPGAIDTGIIASMRVVDDADGAARRVVQRLFKLRNYSPDRVAKAILGAIRRDRPVVPVAPEAWALYYMKRFVPALGDGLSKLTFGRRRPAQERT